jgi:branched-subunit amino acid transport protein
LRFEIILLLAGMAAVTFLPRFLPMALLSRFSLPDRYKNTLEYVPAAIIAAILFPGLLSTNEIPFVVDARLLLSALPVIILCFTTKNIWAAVIAGMLAYWIMAFLN